MKDQSPKYPSFRRSSPAKREEFLREITPGNLRRMCWFIGVYFPISLALLFITIFVLKMPEVILWSIADLGLAVAFFCLAFFGNKHPGLWIAKRWLVRIYYVYCLILMTGYYFSIVDRFGDNSAFVLGVLMASLIFRLPPREFLPILLLNQAIFIAGVLHIHRGQDFVLSALVFGLDALALGIIGAWTLFANDWRNFLQTRALQRANQELRQQAEDNDELMAITAHELASPIDSLKMLFGLLLENPDWKREPFRDVLTSSRDSLGSMQSLVSRLLEAHAAESPHASIVLQPVNLNTHLDRALATVRPTAEVKGIRLASAHSLPSAIVLGEALMVDQVMENLLYNAVKFSLPGTNVEVRIDQTGPHIQCDVLDEGPGIRPEDREHLFRKFYKTTNRPTHGERTFGIGLFIVSKLMEAQQGSVSHHPREPRGSIFRLQFQPAPPKAPAD